ncbi:MAG: phosphoribosylglycinamide formyltransferase [Gammaproteobacteria bacterium]|jgi:phosphoribosylglycinamide formyltransferase-1|nr:phosphoribosylglycinamide formyltransferase [Gammaproteobacteria bacterium]MDP6166305.1 phosphoribosylglycinamide formyltransferase [Gammaproteobacteria bacterium]
MDTSNNQDKPKIVVLISGGGSNLQAIIDQVGAGTIDASINLIISNNPDAKGLQRAATAGIETAVIDHRDYDSRESFDRELMRHIDAEQPQLVILAGFMRIFTPHFTNHYAGRMLNIHPSLLPKFKGTNTHARAIEAGVAQHGASVHFVTSELDGGPLVIQAIVDVKKADSPDQLASRVLQQEHIIYPIAVKWFCEGRLSLDGSLVRLDKKTLPVEGIAYQASP